MGHRASSRRVACVAALECRRLLCTDGLYPAVVDETAADHTAAYAAGDSSVDVLTVPAYSSRPAAGRKVFLDFNGHPAIDNWGGWWEFGGRSVTATPAYDIDGDTFTYSNQELGNILQIWKGVSEKFSPFDVDVTTVKPGTINGVRVVIGGDGSWRGSGGGAAIRDGWGEEGFTDANAGNVAFVWDGQGAAPRTSNPNYIIEAAAHETGHTLGLMHHSATPISDPLNEYAPGLIMGSGGRWGSTSTAGTVATRNEDNEVINEGTQNDFETINSDNGFTWRTDDAGNAISTATALPLSFGSGVLEASKVGVIELPADVDVYSINHTGGSLDIELLGAEFGRMLDPILSLDLASGATIGSSSSDNGSEPGGERVSFNQLNAGTYYIRIRGSQNYGDVGQYRLNVRAGLATTANNDTLSTATLLGAYGSTDPAFVAIGFGGTATLNDGLASNDQFDFFRFRAPANARQIYVRMSGLTTSAGLALYDDLNANGVVESGEFIFATNPGTTPQSTVYSNVVGGRMYAVRVNKSSAAGAGNYQLRITTDAAPPTLLPTAASATFDPGPLRGGKIVYESIDTELNDTVDYYRVRADAAGLFSFYMYDQNSTGDLRLDVGNDANANGILDAGEFLGSSANPGSATEFIQNIAVTSGQQLLVRVTQQAANASNNYYLQAVADYATGGNLNGSLAGARDLSGLKAGAIHEYFDASVDFFDTFRINPVNGAMTAKFVPLELGASHKLEIIRDGNNNGVIEAGEIVASGFANQQLNHTVTAGATYYLRMQAVLNGEFFSSGNYRMIFTTAGAVTGFTSPATAGVVTLSTTPAEVSNFVGFDPLEPSLNNTSDYYQFTLTARRLVGLTVLSNTGNLGANLQIGQDDGSGNFRRIGRTGVSNAGTASLGLNLDPGTYLMRVVLPVNERQTEPSAVEYTLRFSSRALLNSTVPQVTATAAQYEIKPVGVSFTFDQDVLGTVDPTDVTIQNLDTGTNYPVGQVFYDPVAQRAGYSVAAGTLPDGNYRATLAAGAVRNAFNNPNPGTFSLDFFAFAGDANRDRMVNLSDFSILATRFNQPGTFSQGDFDYDRLTDLGDFAILASRFNTSLSPAPSDTPRRVVAPQSRPAMPIPPGDSLRSMEGTALLHWSEVLV